MFESTIIFQHTFLFEYITCLSTSGYFCTQCEYHKSLFGEHIINKVPYSLLGVDFLYGSHGFACLDYNVGEYSLDSPLSTIVAKAGGLHKLVSLTEFGMVAVARDSLMDESNPKASSKLGAAFETSSGRRIVSSLASQAHIYYYSDYMNFYNTTILLIRTLAFKILAFET